MILLLLPTDSRTGCVMGRWGQPCTSCITPCARCLDRGGDRRSPPPPAATAESSVDNTGDTRLTPLQSLIVPTCKTHPNSFLCHDKSLLQKFVRGRGSVCTIVLNLI